VLLTREGFSKPSTPVETAIAPLRRSPPAAIKLILPVWGYKYVRKFLETSLPTMLAPGNVPALASALDCEFIILTSEDDKDFIADHPAFQYLSSLCPTSIRLIDHLITDGNHSTTITLAYTEVVRSVGPAMVDTCFFFLVSDYLVADGSLRNALDRMCRGASAVVVGNFQVDEEEASPWLRNALKAAGRSLSLSPRELMRWALSHLHPATIANIVNVPLSHNSHTNRLFWRVDGTTVVGRFYLKHMICVRPELTDFHVEASCDYSFVPEMCPSGNVEAITDSDEYLVIEMQPRRHESAFLRPGPLRPKVLARSLAEWTTTTHRANAHSTLIFHAEDIPPRIDARIAEADAFVKKVEGSIRRKPQPHRGHPYWRGAMAAFRDATGHELDEEEWQYLLGMSPDTGWVHEWILWRAKNAVMGRAPRVFPWHPAWADFHSVMEELDPFLTDPSKRLLMMSNIPTVFTVALSDGGKRVHRLRCGPFLQRSPERYRSLDNHFDICLLELAENELLSADELLDRIAPMMKPNGAIVLSVFNGRTIVDARAFGPIVRNLGESFIRLDAVPEHVQYVSANPVRWGAYRSLANLRNLTRRWPVAGLPVLAISGGFLILLSGLGNLGRLLRSGQASPRGICSSFLVRLRVDRQGAASTPLHPSALAARARRKRRMAEKLGQDSEEYDMDREPLATSRARVAAASAPAEKVPPHSTGDDGTREPQYNRCVEIKEKFGLTPLGLMTNQVWHDDPRRLTFLLARYKFVSKMLSGRHDVGELGCGDAFGSRIVLQEVGSLTVYDFDPVFIDDINSRQDERWPLKALVHDIVAGPLPDKHDGIYSLDVLEHISTHDEDAYLTNLRASLTGDGVLIIGSPSLESQPHASPLSKAGHINCKSGKELKELLDRYFNSVFIFSMNDEVVHTGFYPMAHYLFAVCSGPRS
jgi:hypothetical protein